MTVPQRALKPCPGGEGGSALGRCVSVLEEEERHAVSLPQRASRDIGGSPLTEAPNDSAVGSSTVPLEFGVGTDGRTRVRAGAVRRALDALEAATSAASPSRASRGSARPTCSPSCAPGGGARAASSSAARRRSSSATCRSASGPTRWTPTSPRRSSTCTSTGARRLAAELGEILPSPAPCRPRAAAAPFADERYRAHRAVARAARAPRAGPAAGRRARRPALGRRGVDRAARRAPAAWRRMRPSSLRSPSGARQAPARLSAALATPSARRIALEPLDRGARRPTCSPDVDPRSRRGDLSPRRRQPVLSRAAQAGGRGREARTRRRPSATTPSRSRGSPCRPRSRRRSPASSPRCRPTELVLLACRGRRRGAFEPISPQRSPSSRRGRRSRHSTRCSRSTSSGRRRFRGASSFATRSCGVRSTSRPRPAGGSEPTRARPRLRAAERGAPAAERAHHVEQYAGQGDEEAIDADARRRRRRRGPGARRSGALVRGGAAPASGRRRDAPGGRACRARVVAALASVSSTAAGPRCSRRSSCFRRTRPRSRVELTAHCAAVEHWLGRHDEAHRRLPAPGRTCPTARRPRPRARDRARRGRPLRARLRAGDRDGPASRSRRRARSAIVRL